MATSGERRELPPAAVIEIIERGRKTDDTAGGSVILPDEVRINGQPLLIEDGGIKVHEINLGGTRDWARVTLTLYARRVIIAGEADL